MADIQKLEKELWEAADNLRANSKLTSQQYCMPVLGLIFLRYAWGRFKMVDEQIKAKRAQSTGRQIPIEPDDYAKRGAMYLPEESRYDYLVNLPEDEANIGKRVNDAMAAIEKVSSQLAGILPQFPQDLPCHLCAFVRMVIIGSRSVSGYVVQHCGHCGDLRVHSALFGDHDGRQ